MLYRPTIMNCTRNKWYEKLYLVQITNQTHFNVRETKILLLKEVI